MNRRASDEVQPTSVKASDFAAEDRAALDRNTLSDVAPSRMHPSVHRVLKRQATLCGQLTRSAVVVVLPKRKNAVASEGDDVAAVFVENIGQCAEAVVEQVAKFFGSAGAQASEPLGHLREAGEIQKEHGSFALTCERTVDRVSVLAQVRRYPIGDIGRELYALKFGPHLVAPRRANSLREKSPRKL
jgi:hypothetical protein